MPYNKRFITTVTTDTVIVLRVFVVNILLVVAFVIPVPIIVAVPVVVALALSRFNSSQAAREISRAEILFQRKHSRR